MPPCFSNHVRSMRCSAAVLDFRFDRSWLDRRIFVDRTFFSLSVKTPQPRLTISYVRGWIFCETFISRGRFAPDNQGFPNLHKPDEEATKIFSSPSSSSIIRDSYFPEDSLGTHHIVGYTATSSVHFPEPLDPSRTRYLNRLCLAKNSSPVAGVF